MKGKELHDEYTTAMHIDMLMDIEGEEGIYEIYEYLVKKYGKIKALEEMGLDKPPKGPAES